MKALATYNGKGGVGKTATAVNLGWLAARDGWRTLLWDLDPQGAASYTFRIRPKVRGGWKRLLREPEAAAAEVRATDFDNLDLLPASASYEGFGGGPGGKGKSARRIRELTERFAQDYDLVLFDCAPGLSAITEGVFDSVDAILAPTIPTPLSLRMLARLMADLKGREASPPALPFFSMVDRRKKLHREVLAFARERELRFLETAIPYSSAVERMATERNPLAVYARSDRSAKAYEALWREIPLWLDAPDGRPGRKAVKNLLHRLRDPGGLRGKP